MAALLVKKYGNRRLYDTTTSKYVTLDELAARIRAGDDLEVIDAQTGQDLTQTTLVQIVLETGHSAKLLPIPLLTQMIRLSDDALADFLSRYVTGALDLYLQAKRGVQSIASFNPFGQLPGAASDALNRMWMAGPFAPQQDDRSRSDAADRAQGERDRDMAALRRELDEIRRAIRGRTRSRPAARKKR